MHSVTQQFLVAGSESRRATACRRRDACSCLQLYLARSGNRTGWRERSKILPIESYCENIATAWPAVVCLASASGRLCPACHPTFQSTGSQHEVSSKLQAIRADASNERTQAACSEQGCLHPCYLPMRIQFQSTGSRAQSSDLSAGNQRWPCQTSAIVIRCCSQPHMQAPKQPCTSGLHSEQKLAA